MKKNITILILIFLFVTSNVFAQQDTQYTHYMYNPSSVNPAFAGYRNTLSATLLHRSQWIGLNGAPISQTFSLTSPLKNEQLALGVNLSNDKIGAITEMGANADFSYTILTEKSNISFGIKAGVQRMGLDPSKLSIQDKTDSEFIEVSNQFSPQIGIGAMLEKSKLFLGVSILNLIETEHLNTNNNPIYNAKERRSYFGSIGYVFTINDNLDLKTTLLSKIVAGAPLQIDASCNLLIHQKITFGAAYRWDAAISGLFGYQITDTFMLGVAYDYDTSPLTKLNSGSGEIIIRYDLLDKLSSKRILNPRIF